MPVLAVRNYKIGGREVFILPNQGVVMVEIKNKPADHIRPVDLHVGIAESVLAGPD